MIAAFGRCGIDGGARERFGIRRGLFGVEREPIAALRTTGIGTVEPFNCDDRRPLGPDGIDLCDVVDGVGDMLLDVVEFR